MKLINMKVIDFINEVDSNSPAPGGGSVSALVSSLGASLARMVGHLSLGKKKYLELSEDIRCNFEVCFYKLDLINKALLDIVDKDTENFNLVMQAFKLPKTSNEEILIRDSEIERATILATETPLKIAELSLDILELLPIFVKYGNKNAISDAGVAALLATAGGKGGIYNVKINLPGIKNTILSRELLNQCTNILEKITILSREIEEEINNNL